MRHGSYIPFFELNIGLINIPCCRNVTCRRQQQKFHFEIGSCFAKKYCDRESHIHLPSWCRIRIRRELVGNSLEGFIPLLIANCFDIRRNVVVLKKER